MELYYRRSCRISLFIHASTARHLEVFENANCELARHPATINIGASGESFRLDNDEEVEGRSRDGKQRERRGIIAAAPLIDNSADCSSGLLRC